MSPATTNGCTASRGSLPRSVPKARSRSVDWAMHDDVIYKVDFVFLLELEGKGPSQSG